MFLASISKNFIRVLTARPHLWVDISGVQTEPMKMFRLSMRCRYVSHLFRLLRATGATLCLEAIDVGSGTVGHQGGVPYELVLALPHFLDEQMLLQTIFLVIYMTLTYIDIVLVNISEWLAFVSALSPHFKT